MTKRHAVRGEPPPRAAAASRAGWRMIALGRFADAQAAFRRAVALGDLSAETLDALDEMTPPDQRPALYAELLGPAGLDWPPPARALLTRRRFDRLRALEPPVEALASAALDALEAAAGSGDPDVWASLLTADRGEPLLAALIGREALLAALEQLAYTPPDAGIHPQAIAFAERVGYGAANDAELRRAAESALHALARGADRDPAAAARNAASRIEQIRKDERAQGSEPHGEPAPTATLVGQSRAIAVAIVGGHDRLRAAIRFGLAERGVTEAREIPPAWEGRRGGGIESLLRGADLVLLLIRQLDHSTAHRAEAVAQRLGIPVRRVPTASAGSAIAAVVDWTRSLR